MAWSETVFTAERIARLTNNFPCILHKNVVEDADSIDWGDYYGGTLNNDVSFSRDVLHDGRMLDYTTPSAASNSTINLLFDFSSSPVTFDTFFVLFQPSSTIGTGDTDYALEVSDNADFSGATVVAMVKNSGDLETSDNDKLFRFSQLSVNQYEEANNPYSIEDVAYVRLKITPGGASTAQPKIYQVWLGQRWDLPNNPLAPFGSFDLRSGVDSEEHGNGVITTYAGYTAKRVLDARWIFDESLASSGINFEYRKMLDSTYYGQKPFLYFDRPAWWTDASMGDFYDPIMATSLMFPDGQSGMIAASPGRANEFFISAEEQGGNVFVDGDPYLWLLEQ